MGMFTMTSWDKVTPCLNDYYFLIYVASLVDCAIYGPRTPSVVGSFRLLWSRIDVGLWSDIDRLLLVVIRLTYRQVYDKYMCYVHPVEPGIVGRASS